MELSTISLGKSVSQAINPNERKSVWKRGKLLDSHVLHEQQAENKEEEH
jgi:hypothetical protein